MIKGIGIALRGFGRAFDDFQRANRRQALGLPRKTFTKKMLENKKRAKKKLAKLKKKRGDQIMGIFGAALRGFGMLGKKGVKPKTRLETFKKASKKQKLKSDIKKLDRDMKSASERAEKFSKNFMKQSYSKSKVNKFLTEEYKKQQRKP